MYFTLQKNYIIYITQLKNEQQKKSNKIQQKANNIKNNNLCDYLKI